MIDPLHQFVIEPIIPLKIGGIDLSFTNSSLAVMSAVVAIYVLFMCGLRRESLVPNRIQAAVEVSYSFIANLIKSNSGREGLRYFPFVFSIFFFVFFGNLLGMIPYGFTFTSHLIVTFTLAMIVFLFVTILGIIRHGTHFFSLFAPKGVHPLLLIVLVPVELLSYLSRPISLAVRLFANMMAGHTMMKVFAGFVTMLLALNSAMGTTAGLIPVIVNVALTGFEVVVSALQAYIFTVLTCVYLNDAIHLH